MKYLSAVNTKLDILSSINECQQAILNDEIHFLRRTNVAGYKVEICGVNTAALPLLKTEEKELLLKKIKNGDTQARTALCFVAVQWNIFFAQHFV